MRPLGSGLTIRMRVESTLADFRKKFHEMADRQLPYAQAQALNAMGFEIAKDMKRMIPAHLNAPINFTINAPMVRKASKRDQVMVVFLRDEASKGTSPLDYLRAEVEGGPRKDKRSERLLKQRGLLASTSQTVTGKSLRDKYGNLQGGGSQYTRMLSQLQAQNDAYQNETSASRKRNSAKAAGPKSRYFVGKPGAGSLPLGVWRRDGKRGLKPVLLFGKARPYRKRFPFYALVNRFFNDRFMVHFERELSKAIASGIAMDAKSRGGV